jgi:hypothetical protein
MNIYRLAHSVASSICHQKQNKEGLSKYTYVHSIQWPSIFSSATNSKEHGLLLFISTSELDSNRNRKAPATCSQLADFSPGWLLCRPLTTVFYIWRSTKMQFLPLLSTLYFLLLRVYLSFLRFLYSFLLHLLFTTYWFAFLYALTEECSSGPPSETFRFASGAALHFYCGSGLITAGRR